MEWTESLQRAIQFIEDHLLEDITISDIAKEVNISPFYFQKSFKIMTGYTVTEYIRNRKLYLAALETLSGNIKIIDLAYKYGYATPESFTKAFSRFHGLSPLQMRCHSNKIKTFLPLKITISIQGGNEMNYVVEEVKNFQVIGFERRFSFDSSYQEIPKYWDNFSKMYMSDSMNNELKEWIQTYNIGEYGICIDDLDNNSEFRYLIAGKYCGQNLPQQDLPQGVILHTFPDMKWAKFRCTGPLPGALQSVNTRIFKEWLPNNPDYQIAVGISIEWYSKGDMNSLDYECEIWVPVKRKDK